MAQAKKKTSTNTRKTSTSSGSSKSRRSSSSNKKPQPAEVEVGAVNLWQEFRKTRVFVPIMVILVAAVLIGLDLLISWNGYKLFFTLLGIEILIAVAIWLIRTVFSIGSNKKRSASNDEV